MLKLIRLVLWVLAFAAACALTAYLGVRLGEMTPTHVPRTPILYNPSANPTAPVSAGPPIYNPAALTPISLQAQSARCFVLMYHDVVEDKRHKTVWFDCTADKLRDQLTWLRDNGATFVSLDQLHKHLVTGEPLPLHSVVLTFDDNYQGVHDFAYPILKEFKAPFAVFVHTNYVGDKSGDHPKMSWETLKGLLAEKLCTIGDHTMSHPSNLGDLPAADQQQELQNSKLILEQNLGIAIPYLAYPDGSQSDVTREIAGQCGYTMAFTMHNGPAEDSPGILRVNRYEQSSYRKAFEAADAEQTTVPADIVNVGLKPAKLRLEIGTWRGVKVALLHGGYPVSLHSRGRDSVGQFAENIGAAGGINGTFFADASLRGTDNTLIGPSRCDSDGLFTPEPAEWRLPLLANRPLVIWGPSHFAIVPFAPEQMNRPEPYDAFMPDYTNLFLSGGWLIHNGTARDADTVRPWAAGDFMDPRKRSFFGLDSQGQIVCGATLDVVTSQAAAEAAAAAGVKEAVLLDSGFSTSLLFHGKIIATGHTAKHLPSRPIPHAILILEPGTNVAAALAKGGYSAVTAPETGSVQAPQTSIRSNK